jgi:hypothetical protein
MELQTLFQREGAVDPYPHRRKNAIGQSFFIQSNGVPFVPPQLNKQSGQCKPVASCPFKK